MLTVGRIFLIALMLYAGSYVVFRQFNMETWEQDGQTYVIFPNGPGRILYYLWRPLSHFDASLTSVGAHIGPHRE